MVDLAQQSLVLRRQLPPRIQRPEHLGLRHVAGPVLRVQPRLHNYVMLGYSCLSYRGPARCFALEHAGWYHTHFRGANVRTILVPKDDSFALEQRLVWHRRVLCVITACMLAKRSAALRLCE